MDFFAIITCSIAVIKLQFSPICRPLASAAWCGPHPRTPLATPLPVTVVIPRVLEFTFTSGHQSSQMSTFAAVRQSKLSELLQFIEILVEKRAASFAVQ